MYFYNYYLELCNKMGIKPSPAGEAIGVTRTAVSGWKKGRIPTDSTLQAMSEYFNVPVSNFFECEDIAEDRGIEKAQPIANDELSNDNMKIRQQLLERPEMKILFDVASDAPTSAIYEAVAVIMRSKEGK